MIRRALLVTAALGLFACTVTVDVTYLGNEVSVSGNWLINGETPTAASCNEAGISTVEIQFNDGVGYSRTEFTFPCAQGSFNTDPQLVLDRTTYRSRWVAHTTDGRDVQIELLDPDGNPIPDVTNGELLLDLTAQPVGGHAELAPANFLPAVQGSTLTVNVGWETVNAVANQACEVSSVDTMSWILKDETGTTILDATDTACAGSIDFTEVLPGTYSIEVSGTSAGGTIDWSTECTGLVIEESTNHSYDCAIPWTSTDPILVVNLRWDADPSPAASYGTCADSGVAMWSYMLTGPASDAMTDVAPCADAFYWRSNGGLTLMPGDYSLFVEGEDSAGAKLWQATCDSLTVGDSDRAIYECQIDAMTP